MQIKGYVLSKCDVTDEGLRPLVMSMSLKWHGTIAPDTADGWMLVYVECFAAQLDFIRADPDIIWIGGGWDEVPQELLTTYAAHLDPAKTYQNLGQVLSKLGEWDSRFLTTD